MMRKRILHLSRSATPVLAGVTALLLFAALTGSRTTQALIPLPVQPFAPEKLGGMSTTALGQPFTDYSVTQVSRGDRRTFWWDYLPPEFSVANDADIPDDTPTGSVTVTRDVYCDSTSTGDSDVLAAASSSLDPYQWQEATTAVDGGPDGFLTSIMPPFPFLLREKADVDGFWRTGGLWTSVDQSWVLNTVHSRLPWPADHGALIATARQGGGVAPSISSALCVDSPDTSTSTTTVYTSPALKGDSNSDGVDDATGLYPRWTAFQSYPHSRKTFQSPPVSPRTQPTLNGQ
jgi:hypothetical protein